MSPMKIHTVFVGLAALGLAVSVSSVAVAQTVTKEVVGELANNEGYLVDGKTFRIVHGKAKGDVSAATITKLNAKEVGPGIIVFRSGDKVYIAEAPAPPAPQAMKNFQDNWAVSYMKAQKDFQDGWALSYMKDASPSKNVQDDWAVSYMKAQKDFQEQWNVAYMKAMKEFQDNWNTSYMKGFQDQWNVSYMKQVKEFQDNWATSYMK
jgi:hypothetical protein